MGNNNQNDGEEPQVQQGRQLSGQRRHLADEFEVSANADDPDKKPSTLYVRSSDTHPLAQIEGSGSGVFIISWLFFREKTYYYIKIERAFVN